jgi:hypothetical protein
VFDDAHAIVGNESLRALAAGLAGAAARPADVGAAGRRALFALDLARAGLDASAFRALNVALHAACGCLVGALARRTFRSPRLTPRFGARADGLAFASALLFCCTR